MLLDVMKTMLDIIYSKGNITLATTSTQRVQALKLLGIRPLMRLKDFAAHGIGPETLARLVREGVVVRPARGLYQLADGPVDARRALQFHGLTLQMPSSVWMAIERTAWRPGFDYPPIRFVRFAASAMTDGVEHHRIEGIEVAITDPARTIVDCFRYRAKVGIDVAMEGLREGLRQRKATSDQLWRYGMKARIWSTMKPYVEVTAHGI